MWSSRRQRIGRNSLGLIGGAIALGLLQACTVEPLNAAKPLVGSNDADSVKTVLAATEVASVNTREAQQVRNALLFAMNGGELQPGGKYKVKLTVTKTTNLRSTLQLTKAATVGQVQIKAGYLVTEKTGNAFVASGTRNAIASFDRKPQSFANQRAERDAVDRASKDAAQQIRLALGQIVAGL